MDSVQARSAIVAKGFGVPRKLYQGPTFRELLFVGGAVGTVSMLNSGYLMLAGGVTVYAIGSAGSYLLKLVVSKRLIPKPQGLFEWAPLLHWQKIGRLIVTFSALSRHMKEEDVRLSWVSSFLMRMVKVSRKMFRQWKSVGKKEGLKRAFFLLMINECVKMGKTIEKIACSYYLTSALFAEHLQHQVAFALFNEFYVDPLKRLDFCPVMCLPSNNQEIRTFDIKAVRFKHGDRTIFVSLGEALRTFPIVSAFGQRITFRKGVFLR